MRRAGLTLVELVVVVAIIALLGAIVLPALSAAKEKARLASCAMRLHQIQVGVITYAAGNRQRLMPFAFSDLQGDVLMSGHWGGEKKVGRDGTECVNLNVLVRDSLVSPQTLLCPSSDRDLLDGKASYFPSTFNFSTYCLRFPSSQDLFREAPELSHYRGRSLLYVYAERAGGQTRPFSLKKELTAPLVRLDRSYAIDPAVAAGDGKYDPASDVMLADGFWRQDYSADGGATAAGPLQPVRAHWSHRGRFNVAMGGGAIKTVTDNGTVAANSYSKQFTPTNDNNHFASYGERIWEFFDSQK